MLKKLLISLIFIGLCQMAFSQKGSVSIFNGGVWYKLAILKKGVYQLDRDYLNSIGVNTNQLDPKNIKIYSTGAGGMIPQSLSVPRPELKQNRILVTGSEDNSFDQGDQVIFYANGPDYFGYNTSTNSFEHEKNLYSDTAFYFLNITQGNSLRVADQAPISGEYETVTWYDDYVVFEEDVTNIRSEGRQWFGPQLFNGSTLEMHIPFQVAGIVHEKPMTLKTRMIAISDVETSFDIAVNGLNVLNVIIPSRPIGDYDPSAIPRSESIEIETKDIPDIQDKLDIDLTYNAPSSGLGNGYLDYIFLEFARELKLYGSSTTFRSVQSTQEQISTFVISEASQDVIVWDITDSTSPINVPVSQGKFNAATTVLKEFVMFQTSNLPKPVLHKKLSNQNILGNIETDAIIVTYPPFRSEAERLAEFHNEYDGLNVKVVTTEHIYNEFSSGMQDISAIRDFVKYQYDLGSGRLKYLLLFGDCSYDYKKRFSRNQNFVPVYEARESLDPIYSYSSDDYYGFLEDHEGEWIEANGFDHTLEIGVGRLPVKNLEEARIMVDKIIRYETSKNVFGPWRNDIYFVADDGDTNIHHRDAELLSIMVDTAHSQFNSTKIYLDAFEQDPGPPERSSATSQRLDEIFAKGGLIVNYTGHGNIDVWADEWILTKNTIRKMTNRRKMPVFVTATCEFGKYDFPLEDSAGEELILNPNGGAIALLTTTRPVFAHTNFVLNRAFYQSVFELENGDNPRLGDIIRKTKNNSLRGPVNRNFALLGDPMMKLAIPDFKLRVTDVVNTANNSDTLSALSEIMVTGEVTTPTGEYTSDFNGLITAKVFDKPSIFKTLGNQNSPFTYTVRNTLLFNGHATVENGRFQFKFVVPKNISYNFDKGKISLYAVSGDKSGDASGAEIDIVVGGSNGSPSQDQTPPQINIYFNDTSFKPGQKVSPNPLLLVHLQDENGINISNKGIGQNLTGILDETSHINLNEFYTAATDTYKEGWISYPLQNLQPGKHSMKIKVWDTYNNFSEREVEFVVSSDSEIIFYEVYNYPNPMTTNTNFVIRHDRDGEELTIDFDIISLNGSHIMQKQYRYSDPGEVIDDITWDGKDINGYPIENGIYIYRFKVTSSLDGATNEIHRRLLISN